MALADSVISVVVETLAGLLVDEVKLLVGVHDKMQELNTELRRMRSFLKDADTRIGDERVRNWVNEIRDAACDAEDVIEDFIVQAEWTQAQEKTGLLTKLKIRFCIKVEHRHMVAVKIESILNRIQSISHIPETYGINSLPEERSSSRSATDTKRRTYAHVEDDIIVGLEEDAAELVEKLKKEDEHRRQIIGIVGMGGVGKTTLARKIFRRDDIRGHFDFCGWAYISQQFTRREVLVDIFLQFRSLSEDETLAIRHLEEEELVVKLHSRLEDKRYLVVIDDIWQAKVWDDLKPAMPNGKSGSKIIFTTRKQEVPLHADPTGHIHRVKCLEEKQSWELLCRKAFPKNPITSCRPGFEDLAKDMLAKCDGLPLAIAVLGSLLATKHTLRDWEIAASNMNDHLDDGVTAILALSYNDLPYKIKPCFLYLAIFPEDYQISVRRLVDYWIAEGFIEGEMMEDVGEGYLLDLVDRNMIHMVRASWSRSVAVCRMHDLMRDFCIFKAQEEGFLKVFPEDVAQKSGNEDKFRRRVFHSSQQGNPPLKLENPHLRSLIYFDHIPFFPTSLQSIHKDFRLLKVLQLQGITALPNVIGKLINLRYLAIWHSGITGLPPSMSCLINLLSLEIRSNSCPVDLSAEMIMKLEKLRYLSCGEFTISGDFRVDCMRKLQTVTTIKAGEWVTLPLENPTSIRKLRIDGLSLSQVDAVLNSLIVKSPSLRYLVLKWDEQSWNFKLGCGNIRPKYLSSTPRCNIEPLLHCNRLTKLHLFSPITALRLPQNLVWLRLEWCLLLEDPMPVLENLPNLRMIILRENSYIGKEMVCSAGGFPSLEILQLVGLYSLEEWRVENGAMPRLNNIHLNSNWRQRGVPEGLKSIIDLKELGVRNMTEEFKNRIRPGGEDWDYVKHIISVDII